MTHVLTDFSLDVLEHAINLNLGASIVTSMKGIANAQVGLEPDIAWSMTDVDFWYLNASVPLGLTLERQTMEVAAARRRANERGVESTWWVSPSADASGLGERLRSQGYANVGGPPAMAVDLTRLNTSNAIAAGLSVSVVVSATMLAEWVDVFVTGYPAPEHCRNALIEGLGAACLGQDHTLRAYLGYLEGKPATVSFMMLAGGVAGIYYVATRKEMRGRGLGRQITLAPLLQARDEGYRIGVLESSDLGYGIYRSIGFEAVFRYNLFMLPDPRQ